MDLITFLEFEAFGAVAEVVLLELFPEFLEPLGQNAEDGWVFDVDFVLADFFVGEERHIFWYFPADEERGVLPDCIFIFFLLLSFQGDIFD